MDEELFSTPRVHVFRVKPETYLVSATWEGGHVWSGALRLLRHHAASPPEAAHSLVLLDPDTNNVFGVCPLYDNGPTCFEQSKDSTRSFVIRLEDGERHAYLGINFESKTEAFRFSTTVIERNNHKQLTMIEVADRSLEAGQKLHLDIAGKLKSSSHAKGTSFSVKRSTGLEASPVSLSAPLPRSVGGSSRRIASKASATTAALPRNNASLEAEKTSTAVGEVGGDDAPSLVCGNEQGGAVSSPIATELGGGVTPNKRMEPANAARTEVMELLFPRTALPIEPTTNKEAASKDSLDAFLA